MSAQPQPTTTALPATAHAEWSPVACISPAAARMYVKLFAWKYPAQAVALASRLDRAAEIMTRAGHRQRISPDLYWIESQSNKHGAYTVSVTDRTCTCPDWTGAPYHMCKHRLAIGLQLFGPAWHDECSATRLKAYRHADGIQKLLAEAAHRVEHTADTQGTDSRAHALARATLAQLQAQAVTAWREHDALKAILYGEASPKSATISSKGD